MAEKVPRRIAKRFFEVACATKEVYCGFSRSVGGKAMAFEERRSILIWSLSF